MPLFGSDLTQVRKEVSAMSIEDFILIIVANVISKFIYDWLKDAFKDND